MVANVDDPSMLAHLIAGALRIPTEEKQALLEELDVAKRLRKLSEILARELEVVAIGSKIQSQVQSELDKGQREYFLRQQLKAIQEELGEGDEVQAEVNDLRQQLEETELPEVVRKQVDRELARLERLQPAMAEYGVVRALPRVDRGAAVGQGDRRRPRPRARPPGARRGPLRHRAGQGPDPRVSGRQQAEAGRDQCADSVLCFVGPPGVGKTSLGRSMARALGRNFERISVGRLRDEAEIRGHRRTYIGALPGVIIRALRDAGVRNPLLMLDEIDKLGSDFRGDPSSALLEVLDPEQNSALPRPLPRSPFDLSEVMFVCTANTLDTIPGPLRDRMEVIQLAGLHRGGEAPDRPALPGPAPDRAQRSQRRQDRLHATRRYARSSPTTRARPASASSSARSARSAARWRGRSPRAAPNARSRSPSHASASSSASAVLLRDAAADGAARRRNRTGVDAGGRRGALHRGNALCPGGAV